MVSFLYAALSGGTLLQYVMSQLSYGNDVHKFHEKISSLYFYRAEVIVHAFIIELDQPDYW